MRFALPLALATLTLAAAAPNRGIAPAHLDTTTKPEQDFFRFATGGWQKANAIPSDMQAWGAFNELREANRATLRAIMETASASKAELTSPQGKVGAFYAAGMDTATVEKLGLTTLQPRLDRIARAKDAVSLATVFASLQLEGIGVGFGCFVGQDDKDSSAYILQLAQGGLGLPDRDFYTLDDARSKELRAGYVAYLAAMQRLLGSDEVTAKREASAILDLETRLAQASMTLTDQRDPNAVYHKLTPIELEKLAPAFPWAAYFKTLGVPPQKHLLVRQPDFFKAFGTLVKDVPVATWQAYLRAHVTSGFAEQLPEAFGAEKFAFFGKMLNGLPERQARWKRVQNATDSALGEILGQLYIEKAFSPEAKRKMLQMVADLREALGERIKLLPWMGEATKKAALGKLAAFRVKVGYPDQWRDCSRLEVKAGAYLENVAAAQVFETRRNLARLGTPVNREEWGMTPQTVNAYYDPSMNEIVFPAGILQPPFFDAAADDAVNYGAIGMVIGHEMTHGFDDQGCQYDAKGNLKNWWTAADTKAYASRTTLVEQQAGAWEALPGLKLNGKLTLGENIADLGGLKIAFEALKRTWTRGGKPGALDGFTPEQRFFLGYAQSWRSQSRDEALRMQVMTDPHSPAKFRVNGPLANMPEFFQAFSIPEGSEMRRPDAVRPTIW